MTTSDRLERQLDFILEADAVKHVVRRNPLADASRRENDAEHMWHLALMAAVLAEHADERVDLARVLLMLLVHDLVEIDAGDTYVYDVEARLDKEERERLAADRIFGLLPDDQAQTLRALWDEFEARVTPESRFAYALDRLQPLMMNFATKGVAWREHGVTSDRVLELNSRIAEGSRALWDHAHALIMRAVERGYLDAGPDSDATTTRYDS